MSRQQPQRSRENAGSEGADGESRPLDRRVHLPSEEAFSVLRNDRRRATIAVLARERRACSIEEISRAVAASEHGVPAAHVTERQRKCVYVSLLQIHLPELVDAGVIEWDEREGTIEGRRSIGALAGVVSLVERACTGIEGD